MSERDQLTQAEIMHRALVKINALYEETAHWTPVISTNHTKEALLAWFAERNLVRGDRENRNDYLCPVSTLFLFKDPRVAVEFKLTWG